MIAIRDNKRWSKIWLLNLFIVLILVNISQLVLSNSASVADIRNCLGCDCSRVHNYIVRHTEVLTMRSMDYANQILLKTNSTWKHTCGILWRAAYRPTWRASWVLLSVIVQTGSDFTAVNTLSASAMSPKSKHSSVAWEDGKKKVIWYTCLWSYRPYWSQPQPPTPLITKEKTTAIIHHSPCCDHRCDSMRWEGHYLSATTYSSIASFMHSWCCRLSTNVPASRADLSITIGCFQQLMVTPHLPRLLWTVHAGSSVLYEYVEPSIV